MKKALLCLAVISLVFMGIAANSESAVAQLQEMYASAELKMATADYAGAAAIFDSMGSYSDCSQMAMYCKAISAAEDLGLYDMAIDAFAKLGDFKDCAQMIVYYTGREGEAAADVIIERLDTCGDDELKQAKTYLYVAKNQYSELALFKDCMSRIASCKNKESQIDGEINKRNDAYILSVYESAKALEEMGKYLEAIEVYESIIGYKDTSDRIETCRTLYKGKKYNEAMQLRDKEMWDEAVASFSIAGDYSDAQEQILITRYMEGTCRFGTGDYPGAANAFGQAGTYSDATERCLESWYMEGLKRRENKDWNGAVKAFGLAGEYRDAKDQISETNYLQASDCIENNEFIRAVGIYQSIDGYKDSAEKVKEYTYAIGQKYEEAQFFLEAGKYYASLGSYLDAADRAVRMNELSQASDYYAIKSGKKYGFCTQSGEIVLDCQWTSVSDFDGGLAIVNDGDKKSGVINKAGEYVLPYENCAIWKRGDEYIERWDRHYKHELYNMNGELVFEIDNCSKFKYGEGIIAYLLKDYQLYFYDIATKKTVHYKGNFSYLSSGFSDGWCAIYDYCLGKDYKSKLTFKAPVEMNLDDWFHDGLLKVQNKSTKSYGYADTKGNLVIPCEWGYYSGDFNEGFVNVQDKRTEKWGYIDTHGNMITEVIYTSANSFSDGLACVVKDGKAGYIDQTGKLTISLQFDYAYDFHNGYATVTMNGEQFYINKSGEKVLPRDYDDLKNMVPVF